MSKDQEMSKDQVERLREFQSLILLIQSEVQ